MADKLNPKRTAVTLATFAALLHLLWVVFVAAGFGQWLVNFKLGLHFLSAPLTVTAFDPLTAFIGVALAFLVGYVVGWFFAWVWNKSAKWK